MYCTLCVGGYSTVEGAHDHIMQFRATTADQTASNVSCAGSTEGAGTLYTTYMYLVHY